jgi:hypothetical protein
MLRSSERRCQGHRGTRHSPNLKYFGGTDPSDVICLPSPFSLDKRLLLAYSRSQVTLRVVSRTASTPAGVFCFLESASRRFVRFSCETHPIISFILLRYKFFRINTCETVSKQTTLTSFRINTYEKPGGEGVPPQVQTGRIPDRLERAHF